MQRMQPYHRQCGPGAARRRLTRGPRLLPQRRVRVHPAAALVQQVHCALVVQLLQGPGQGGPGRALLSLRQPPLSLPQLPLQLLHLGLVALRGAPHGACGRGAAAVIN